MSVFISDSVVKRIGFLLFVADVVTTKQSVASKNKCFSYVLH